jgi:hypothetical protein
MIICSKCNIEKEDNNFQTYWHSTQKKHFTRKTCTECHYKQRNERRRLQRKESKLIEVSTPTEIIQPEVTELEIEVSYDYSNDPNYKLCRTCNEYKLIETEYYMHNIKSKNVYMDCRTCHLEKDRQRRLELVKETGGSLRHYEEPDRYYDEYQKEATFEIMYALGWTYNDNGVWSKEGIKDKENNWFGLKKPKRKIKKSNGTYLYFTDEQILEFKRQIDRGGSITRIAEDNGINFQKLRSWINEETD